MDCAIFKKFVIMLERYLNYTANIRKINVLTL